MPIFVRGAESCLEMPRQRLPLPMRTANFAYLVVSIVKKKTVAGCALQPPSRQDFELLVVKLVTVVESSVYGGTCRVPACSYYTQPKKGL